MPMLLAWRNCEDFRSFCTMRRTELTTAEFEAELNRDFSFDRHLQLMICRLSDGEPVGTIYSYNLNRYDGYVYITTYIDETHRNSFYAVSALALLMKHLFEEFGLFKIYCEVYSHNQNCLPLFEKTGWTKEGISKGHKRNNGDRSDLIRFAFFAENREKLNRYT